MSLLQVQGGFAAAFGRLCVETQFTEAITKQAERQPPSGGCVLKLQTIHTGAWYHFAAAFGRLCVETISAGELYQVGEAAAFGRLCVETGEKLHHYTENGAATFRWLCVKTKLNKFE